MPTLGHPKAGEGSARFSRSSSSALKGAVAALAALALAASAAAQAEDLLDQADRLAAQPKPLSQAMVDLKQGADPAAFARRFGLRIVRTMRSLPNAYIMAGASPQQIAALIPDLEAHPWVEWTFQDQQTKYEKFSPFTPNDPFFFRNNPAGYPGQWHLQNPDNLGGVNIDTRVWNAWQRGVTGQGVVIGIADDSMEVAHPDLSPNHSAADSFDFGQNDGNPSPVHSTDNHGTAVAGVAGARGGNGIGLTGAAPFATLAGLRVDFPNQTLAMFVDATLYRSSGAITTIKIKNHSYGITAPYINDASASAFDTSAAAGTIHVIAAGNNRNGTGQDSNTKDSQNQPSVIAVSALGQNGTWSHYSCFGANVFVTAPSSSAGFDSIQTTDRTGTPGYNNGSLFGSPDYAFFGGTSSASPLVAGVLALVKEVQPALDVRFAKHLLARFSDIVHSGDTSPSSDGGWKTNAAGLRFNQNYGFGLINADRLTTNAVLYSGVSPLSTEEVPTTAVSAPIPDGFATGITRTFPIFSNTPLEEIEVALSITHLSRGQLEAYLTSPSGTTGRLMLSNTDTGDHINWRFITNAFWGENPAGVWTIRVADRLGGTSGTWNSFGINMRMGSLIPIARVSSLTVTPASVRGGISAVGTVTLDTVAPSGGVNVSLSSASAAVVVPGTVTVPAGQASVQFAVATSGVSSPQTVTLSATRPDGSSATASLELTRAVFDSLALSTAALRGGLSATGTVSLIGQAPPGGRTVTLSSNNTGVTVPASVVVPEGQSSATFPIATAPARIMYTATITAAESGVVRTARLEVQPPTLLSVVVSPARVLHLAPAVGTVTIEQPAPVGGVPVLLATLQPTAATVPSSVLIPAGETTASFPVTTLTVGRLSDITVRATLGRIGRSGVFRLEPPLVTSAQFSPATVRGGENATLNVTIQSPAPTGGVMLTLRTTSPNLIITSPVTIPAGQTSLTVVIGTRVVTANHATSLNALTVAPVVSAPITLTP